ncbi:N-acetylglucosamine kinase [Acholeplasma hippikon]|uniref:BadF/BadG/BcrA/BcrD ATPase family n=1 Tax=Acholeplasma hippikon TaxID=264636 RepID=A0A449BLJ3_9MOLU|nr:BadF/BadG/BcrA/BcrD ATPase family protein [Acholeplasma hippikon]VEU83310.1 BadF/BadG/BcrA/BcrD ATPase family [Acholeplasma hippikon]
MKYFLGIDGGGTKTKVIIINENEKIIYESIGGPSSIDTVPLYLTYQNIYESLKPFLDKNDIELAGVFAGLGGIVFKDDKEKVKDILKQLPCVTSETKIKVENDMYNALYSGLLFDEGMCLICGTGMVAFGLDKQNNRHKAGGWGYKEGELGSGYHLGMEAIRYMIRCFDGRYQVDSFAKDIAFELNLSEASDIIPIMDELHNNRTKVASLAPFVTKYANLDHEFASIIVERATSELALAIEAVFHRLKLHHPKIVIVGSLGNVDGKFKNLLHKKIKRINEHIEILKPAVDPALAAALYAIKL